MYQAVMFRHWAIVMLVTGRIRGDFAVAYGAEMNGVGLSNASSD